MGIELKHWHSYPQAYALPIDAISELVGSIGTRHFEKKLLALFDGLIGADRCRALTRAEGERTQMLFSIDTSCRTQHGGGCGDLMFQNGDPYRFDGETTNCASPKACLATAARGMPQELVIHERIENRYVYICLSRSDDLIFDSAEIAAAQNYASLVISALRQHLALMRTESHTVAGPQTLSAERRQKLLSHIRSDLMRLGSVSPREAEVCAHIAIGYNVNAISMLLGISQNTASTHRKRAYAKLGISSQNELFARYLEVAPNRHMAGHTAA